MECVRLKDICQLLNGRAYKQEELLSSGKYKVLRVGNFFSDKEYLYSDLELEDNKYCDTGDLLFAWSASFGPKIWDGGKVIYHYHIWKMVLSDIVNKEYLYYYLLFMSERIKGEGHGGIMIHTTKQEMEERIVPLPCLEEQKRIVDKLKMTSKIISDRKGQLEELDRLIKARFVEMFGDPVNNPKGWKTYQLDDCLERIDNGKSFVCSDKPRIGNYPAVLKLSAATYGDYRPNENKALLDESQFVEGAEVHPGDLLFTRKNTPELVGMAAYVQETPVKLMMPDLIFRLVPNEKMNPVFLWQLINCKEFRPIIQGISGGSAKSMSNISKERLGKIRVICPPRVLQDELIPFVTQIDKSKLTVQKSLDGTQKLFDSLMQEYFG